MGTQMPEIRHSDPVTQGLADVLRRVALIESGTVADYIPELATADPDALGISAISVLGGVYHAGNSDRAFTIQSISKPFVYALALSELGVDGVHGHVGFEPSGERSTRSVSMTAVARLTR